MRYFAESPVIAVRDMPREAKKLRRLRQQGALWSPLPGIFAHRDTPDGWELRIQAAHLWAPEAVVCGAAAARLTWWPDLPLESIDLHGVDRRPTVGWLHVSRATVDPELYRMAGPMKIAVPALTVLQLTRTRGGVAIDEALRRGAATLPEIRDALDFVPRWNGSEKARRLLRRSRNEPWSRLERQAHELLDKARIVDWRGNYEVRVAGQRFFIDIAFPGAKIAIEIDGFDFHRTREAFDRDREKQNLLVLAGWTVLRFTSNTIHKLVPHLRALLKVGVLSP
ncbi:MAG: DUF559 domain-containing protein [Propionibacterium sp.]|nr:DUF559 domain-containing protein [Propionibacterium sp.]